MLKAFSEYIKEGIVKKIKPDFQRAESLKQTAERKRNSLNVNIQKVGIMDENANDYIEYGYDILAILIRAKMLIDGFNASGIGAHEAEVSYLRALGFNETEVQFVDQMRYFRNGILYYGTLLDKEYAEKVFVFLNKIYPKLKSIIKNGK